MKILVACDSFKDALGAAAVCKAVAEGVRDSHPQAAIVEFPLADGGEGTVAVLTHHLGLHTVHAAAVDPLFREMTASYGISADTQTAVIEMATASGLQLLAQQERDPLETTTLGTGMLIAAALQRNVKHLVLAIGGSSTNDAGIGVAVALGWRFLDGSGQELPPIGASLEKIVHLVPPSRPMAMRIEVMCDVTNPLYGPQGAAQVYARQKGADDASIAHLDAGLRNVAACVEEQLHLRGLAEVPGAGAAGGLGFGAMSFLGASLRRGIDVIMDLTHIDAAIQRSDLIITGEGHLDGQTLHGKLIHGVCQRGAKHSVPVIALCGKLSATAEQVRAIGLKDALSINEHERPLSEMLVCTAENLRRTAARLFR